MSRYHKPLADAVFLLKKLQQGTMPKEELTVRQRYICAAYLMAEEKYTHQEIADMLGVHRVTIHKYSQKMHRNASFMLDSLDERSIATMLIQKAQTASARLFRKGRETDALDIQFRLVDKLQSLGFLKKKPLEIEGKVSFKALMEIVNSETPEGIGDDHRIIEIEPPKAAGNGFHENGGGPFH